MAPRDVDLICRKVKIAAVLEKHLIQHTCTLSYSDEATGCTMSAW